MPFDITINNTNTPVEEGQTLSVDYTVTNTGASTDTQNVDLNLLKPVTVIDNFESYPLGATQATVTQWGPDDFVIGNTQVAEGAQSMEMNGNDVDILTSREGSGLNYYPGEEPVRCLLYWDGISNVDLSVAVPTTATDNNTDSYRLRIGVSDNLTLLRKTQGGSTTHLDTAPLPTTSNTWLDMCIDRETVGGNVELDAAIWAWNAGTSTWSQVVSLTGTDTAAFWSNTDRGVGLNQFRGGASGLVMFDHLRVAGPPSEPPEAAPGNF